MRLGFPIVIISFWLLISVFGPMLAENPNYIDLTKILVFPFNDNVLGYDDLGRSLWDRTVMGARTSFFVSFFVVSITLIIGTLIGTFSAYIGGMFDHVMVRIMDVFLAFPGLLLAIALAGLLGPGIENVIIALTVVGWVGFARLCRAQVLSLKNSDHIQSAKALGVNDFMIVSRHLIPLVAAPLIVEATFSFAGVIISEAGLSFLGLGIQPPNPSWGSIIKDGSRYLLVAPHMVLIPGFALMLVVLSINLLGDRLRDFLDVKQK